MWKCTISTNTRSVLYPLLPWWRLCAAPHLRRNWWTSPWMVDTEAVSLHLLLVMKCTSHECWMSEYVRTIARSFNLFVSRVQMFWKTVPPLVQALPPWKLTSPHPRHFLKMIFLFPRWDMLVSWRVNILKYSSAESEWGQDINPLFHVA